MSQLDIQNLRVRLGAHNLLASERTTQDFKVTRVVRHKDYDSRKLVSRMLRRDKKIKLTKRPQERNLWEEYLGVLKI